MIYLHAEHRFYFATASLRNINNTQEVIKEVFNKTNIKIDVLSSASEALLSFNYIKEVELSNEDGILIDVGGGSSEITLFENHIPTDSVSIPFGSLNSYYKHVSLMFPKADEIQKIKEDCLSFIKESNIKQKDETHLYAVGGTIRNIKKLLVRLNIITNSDNTFDVSKLDILLSRLNKNTKECYKNILQIKPERIHTLVPGIIIIQTICEYYNIEEIHVCKSSLREGYIYSIINEGEHIIEEK